MMNDSIFWQKVENSFCSATKYFADLDVDNCLALDSSHFWTRFKSPRNNLFATFEIPNLPLINGAYRLLEIVKHICDVIYGYTSLFFSATGSLSSLAFAVRKVNWRLTVQAFFRPLASLNIACPTNRRSVNSIRSKQAPPNIRLPNISPFTTSPKASKMLKGKWRKHISN